MFNYLIFEYFNLSNALRKKIEIIITYMYNIYIMKDQDDDNYN